MGEQHVLIAARLIAVSSTLLLGLTLAWLVRRIFNDRVLAAFAAAVFLSGDVLLYRGWLAYVDPLFSLLTFGAMSALWVAVEERRRDLFFLADARRDRIFSGQGGHRLLLLRRIRACSALAPAPTGGFLFSPWSIALHGVAIAFPFVWSYAIVGDTVVWAMLDQVWYQRRGTTARSTLSRSPNSLSPIRFVHFLYLLPTSAVVLYGLLSRAIAPATFRQNSVLIALSPPRSMSLPYWLAPASSPRYLLPIYPFVALAMAYAVLHAGRLMADLSVKALIATVARRLRGGVGRLSGLRALFPRQL